MALDVSKGRGRQRVHVSTLGKTHPQASLHKVSFIFIIIFASSYLLENYFFNCERIHKVHLTLFFFTCYSYDHQMLTAAQSSAFVCISSNICVSVCVCECACRNHCAFIKFWVLNILRVKVPRCYIQNVTEIFL